MRYELRLTAFDVMDTVHISLLLVSDEKDPEGHAKQELHEVSSLTGEGISDPREWTRDVLVAALEAL